MVRTWILALACIACGSNPQGLAPPPAPADPAPITPPIISEPLSNGAAPAPSIISEPLSNAAPPTDAGAANVIDAPCPRQCMDTCCQANEICQHGGGDDGTFAHCRKPR